MTRILILGGTGFVGSTLSAMLIQNTDNEITIGSSRSRQLHIMHTAIPGLQTINWDVRNQAEIAPDFDVIIHAATPASAVLNSNNPSEMLEIIVNGMKNVISFAAKHQKPPTILLTSSGAVYGTIPDGVVGIPEDFSVTVDPTKRVSAYADGKRKAEHLLSAATSDGTCRGLIARMFAFSGVNLPLDRHFAIGNFVRDVVNSGIITIRSDGSSIRSYMDGEDMAIWLRRVIEAGAPDEIYHIGSERSISIRDLATLVVSRYELISGNEASIEVLGQSSPIDGVSRYVPSTQSTREKLGLRETVSLESSIDQMIIKAKNSL